MRDVGTPVKFLPVFLGVLLLAGCSGVGLYPNGMSRNEWNRLPPAEQNRLLKAQNQRRAEVGLATQEGALGAAAAGRQAADRAQAGQFEPR